MRVMGYAAVPILLGPILGPVIAGAILYEFIKLTVRHFDNEVVKRRRRHQSMVRLAVLLTGAFLPVLDLTSVNLGWPSI